MLVFQRSGVYIDMGSHRNTLLCFRYLSVIAFHQWSSERVYFTLIFLFQNRLCGTDKATAVYYDKTREGNYKGKIQG